MQWQEPVAQVLISGECRSAKAALVKLGLKEVPRPSQRPGIKSGMLQALKLLHQARKICAQTLAEHDLAGTPKAQAIDKKFEALLKEIEPLILSSTPHAQLARPALPSWKGDGEEDDVAA